MEIMYKSCILSSWFVFLLIMNNSVSSTETPRDSSETTQLMLETIPYESSSQSTTLGPPNLTSELSSEQQDTSNTTLSPEDYVTLVEEHIFPKEYEWIFICMNFLVLVVGLMGNFLVCYVVKRNHSMQTVTNIFIVNLAVADFCVLLFCLPPTVIWDVTETWFFGKIPCKMILYFQTISVSVSVCTLTAISVDRWYAICHPLQFKSTINRAKFTTLIIWMFSLLIDLPEVLYLKTESYHFTRPDINTIYLTGCLPKWGAHIEMAFTITKFMLLFLFPLIFMGVAYFQIVHVLWRNDDELPSVISQLQARRKAAKMLVAVVVMFGLCYLPVHAISIARIFTNIPNTDTNKVVSQLSHLLVYANSSINPLIYNFMSGKFRREFRRAIMCSAPEDDLEPKLHYKTTSVRTNRVEQNANRLRIEPRDPEKQTITSLL